MNIRVKTAVSALMPCAVCAMQIHPSPAKNALARIPAGLYQYFFHPAKAAPFQHKPVVGVGTAAVDPALPAVIRVLVNS